MQCAKLPERQCNEIAHRYAMVVVQVVQHLRVFVCAVLAVPVRGHDSSKHPGNDEVNPLDKISV